MFALTFLLVVVGFFFFFHSLNSEKLGPFQRIEEGDSYRDVQILQKTDESVGQICEMLGWGAHLERLVGVKEEKQKVWD